MEGSISVVTVTEYLTHTSEDMSGPTLEKKPTDVRTVINVSLARMILHHTAVLYTVVVKHPSVGFVGSF